MITLSGKVIHINDPMVFSSGKRKLSFTLACRNKRRPDPNKEGEYYLSDIYQIDCWEDLAEWVLDHMAGKGNRKFEKQAFVDVMVKSIEHYDLKNKDGQYLLDDRGRNCIGVRATARMVYIRLPYAEAASEDEEYEFENDSRSRPQFARASTGNQPPVF